jgi:hypothetical protein
MALVRCPDYGRDISSLAPTRPGCGRPMQNAPPLVAFGPPLVPPPPSVVRLGDMRS